MRAGRNDRMDTQDGAAVVAEDVHVVVNPLEVEASHKPGFDHGRRWTALTNDGPEEVQRRTAKRRVALARIILKGERVCWSARSDPSNQAIEFLLL